MTLIILMFCGLKIVMLVSLNIYICIYIFCDTFMMSLAKFIHKNCINNLYPFSEIKRFPLTIEEIPWSYTFTNYDPPEYNSKILLNKPWADPPLDDEKFKPKWNQLDGLINRVSHIGTYNVTDGSPQNPQGRTGVKGRGILGKWGPNHAADPIVTRWKMVDGHKEIGKSSNLPILQFCAIQRKDNGQWAIPGGMVDPGEQVSETLKREFLEEALNSLELSEDEYDKNKTLIERFFKGGEVVYKGYVDDPRNTDNSWMETVVVNFHDNDGESVGKFELLAGDDAQNVRWMDIDKSLNLYASHSSFIETVVKRLQAHW